MVASTLTIATFMGKLRSKHYSGWKFHPLVFHGVTFPGLMSLDVSWMAKNPMFFHGFAISHPFHHEHAHHGQALRVAGLAEMVSAFPKKLEHQITDEGGRAKNQRPRNLNVWGKAVEKYSHDDAAMMFVFVWKHIGIFVESTHRQNVDRICLGI